MIIASVLVQRCLEGASTINIADTVGIAFPWGFADLLCRLQVAVPELAGVVISAHCHNDRGLATANTLAAIQAGARQVECTVNGIGERTGNASLEQVVTNVSLSPEEFLVWHGVDTTKFCDLSRLVADACGQPVALNQPFVGKNAFAHESGIHQDGTIKDSSLYELCPPEVVGNERRLPLGKLSGRAGIQARLAELGMVVVSDDQLKLLASDFSDRMACGGDSDTVLREVAAKHGLAGS